MLFRSHSAIRIKDAEAVERMRVSNRIVAMVLDEMKKQVRPGVSTLELDKVAEEIIRSAVTNNEGVAVFEDLPAGQYRIVNTTDDDYMLDVNGASKAWGQNVIQWQANGGANQKWRISVDANNRATFTNVNSGLVFDVSGGKADWGAPMIQWGANGGLNQKWSLVAVK